MKDYQHVAHRIFVNVVGRRQIDGFGAALGCSALAVVTSARSKMRLRPQHDGAIEALEHSQFPIEEVCQILEGFVFLGTVSTFRIGVIVVEHAHIVSQR